VNHSREKYWPNEHALGKHIEQVGIHDQTFEIVGIVGDTANQDLRREPPAVAYFPLEQTYLMFPWQPDVSMLVRGHGDTEHLLGSIRRAVADVDLLCLYSVSGHCESTLQAPWAGKVFGAALAGFCPDGGNACRVGVFGLISYSTARATHDFGIRWRGCSKRACAVAGF